MPINRHGVRVTPFAVALAAIVFVYYLLLTKDRFDLIVAADEVGFLSNAWFLSGTRSMFHMTSASYYPWGCSLLMAPVFWITTDPHLSYHLAVVENCLLIALASVNLFFIWLRYVGNRVWLGFFVCLVVSLYPALQLNAGLLWSEVAFATFFVFYANAASLFIKHPNGLRALALCLISAYLYAIHQRALLLPLVSVSVVISAVARGRCSKAVVIYSLLFSITLFLAVRHINHYFQSHGWDAVVARNNGVFNKIRGLLNPEDLLAVVRSALGQLWYLSFSTGGLIWIALFGAAASAFKLLARSERSSDGSGRDIGWQQFSLVVVLGFAAVFVASAAAITVPARADHYIYGRYIDGVVPVMLLFAFMCLVQVPLFKDQGSKWSSILILIVGGLGLLLSQIIPDSNKIGVLGLTIPSTIVLHTGSRLAATLAVGTCIVAVFISLIALSGRRRAATALVLMGIGFVFSGGSAAALVKSMAAGTKTQMAALVDVARFVKPQRAAFVFSGPTASSYYHAQAYLPAWDFVSTSPRAAERETGLVVAGSEWGHPPSATPRYQLPSAAVGAVNFWYQGDPQKFLSGGPVRQGEELLSPANRQLYLIRGFYSLEKTDQGYGRWTDGDGEFVFAVPRDQGCVLRVRMRNLSQKSLSVALTSGDPDQAKTLDILPGETGQAVLEAVIGVVDMHVRSGTFVPGGRDQRALGVMLTSVQVNSCSRRP